MPQGGAPAAPRAARALPRRTLQGDPPPSAARAGAMISWQDLGAALALVLIFEGLLPFLSPDRWRRTLEMIRGLNDGQLRSMGLILMSIGALVLYIVRF